ncbi:MAG TPA: choice-of-anchor Q domain-containing protein [Thermoflexales bacterium]|nr:choice-of-anchor Q domain-containing protein [Thermoflexales bacterium]
MQGRTGKGVAFGICGLVLGMAFGLARSAPASAATIVVNDPVDVMGVNGACSLREAITSINIGAPINIDCPNMVVQPFGTNDTINLTVNTQIAINGASEDANLTGDFDILQPVVINAAGPIAGPVPAMCAIAPAMPAPCVSAAARDRVFDVYAPNVVFNNFSIVGGDAPSPEGGGAIRINGPSPILAGDLKLSGMMVGRSFANIMPGMDGGIIWNNSKLTADSSFIFQGRASQFGGGIYNTNLGSITLNRTVVSSNMADINGGGVYNTGTASALGKSKIYSNTATSNGGGVYNASLALAEFVDTEIYLNAANAGLGLYNVGTFAGWTMLIYSNTAAVTSNGGGIYNSGDLLIAADSRIFANSVSSGGGIYNLKKAEVAGTWIYSNTASLGTAAGIYNAGEFLLSQSVVASNTMSLAFMAGSGIWNETGGIFTSTNTLVQGNTGGDSGLGVGNDDHAQFLMIGGAVRNHTASSDGANVYNSGSFAMTAGAVLENGKASAAGGNLYNDSVGNAYIINSNILSGTATSGGGVWNAGSVVMTGARVISNVVSQYGGGIYTSGFVTLTSGTQIDKNTSTYGGGLYINTNASAFILGSRVFSNTAILGGGMESALTSTLIISNSLVYSNAASTIGGGLYTLGFTSIEQSAVLSNVVSVGSSGGWGNAGAAWVTNTTFSGNYAGSSGGAILNTISGGATGAMTLTNVTVANNTTPSNYALSKAGAASLTLKNTLVADNTPANCGISGAIISLGYNLDSGSTCGLSGSGDQSNASANLSPLAMNAPGNTPTHALKAGSAAINSATNAGCPSIDQRGAPRPLGGTCDIGAYESQLFPRAFLPSSMRDYSASW